MKETSHNILSTKFLGYPRARRRVSCFEIRERFVEIFFEEFVRRGLIDSPLIKPLLTPGG